MHTHTAYTHSHTHTGLLLMVQVKLCFPKQFELCVRLANIPVCRVSRFSAFLRKNYNKGEWDGGGREGGKEGGRGREREEERDGKGRKGGIRRMTMCFSAYLQQNEGRREKVRKYTGKVRSLSSTSLTVLRKAAAQSTCFILLSGGAKPCDSIPASRQSCLLISTQLLLSSICSIQTQTMKSKKTLLIVM